MPSEGYIGQKHFAGSQPKWSNCWGCPHAYNAKAMLYWYQVIFLFLFLVENVIFAEAIHAEKGFEGLLLGVQNHCSF